MIVIMGDIEEPMIEDTLDLLEQRGADHCYLAPDHFPHEVSLSLGLPGSNSGIQWRDGSRVCWSEVTSIYHRLGFTHFETEDEEYSEAEEAYAGAEFMSLLNPILNTLPARIANRPLASATNASKPYQANLIQQAGFLSPRRWSPTTRTTPRSFINFITARSFTNPSLTSAPSSRR